MEFYRQKIATPLVLYHKTESGYFDNNELIVYNSEIQKQVSDLVKTDRY